MTMVKVGDIFNTNSGGSVTVIAKVKSPYYIVRHNDETEHEQYVKQGNIVRGKIKNPYLPSVFGKGYIGMGRYTASVNSNRTKTPEYQAWKGMLRRCYSNDDSANNGAYIGATVCDEWLNFQNFALWYCNNGYYGYGYHLDKDLIQPGNKVYSPETCCMLPAKINTMLINKDDVVGKLEPQGIQRTPSGKYIVTVRGRPEGKTVGTYSTIEEAVSQYNCAKEKRVRDTVNEYKGKLDPWVKDALLNWRVR